MVTFCRVGIVGLSLLAMAGPLAGQTVDTPQYVLSIAAKADGTIMLADRNLPGVWKLTEGTPSLFFRGDKRFRTPLNAIRCLEFDREGKLLAGDSSTRDVYRFDDQGQPQPLTRILDQPPAGQIGIPMDIAVNSAGDIYVTDLEIARLMKIPRGGGELQEIAQISGCRGLFVDGQDNVWVVSTTKDQLFKITPAGQQQVVVPDRPFEFPHTVVVTADGTAYVCDGYAKAIWKVPPGGAPEKFVAGEPLANPVGMELVGDKLLIADPRAQGVFAIALTGEAAGKLVPLWQQAPVQP